MRLHGGSGNPVISHILVARTQPRLSSKSVEKLPSGLPIIWVLGLRDRKIVSIWGQSIFRFVCFNLLLITTKEEGTPGVLDIKSNPLLFQISERAEQIALPGPPMGSAEIRNNVNFESATIATSERGLRGSTCDGSHGFNVSSAN
jgi:hypothetical protein